MTSKTTSTCGPCSYRQMGHNALVWCLDCKEGLCDDCKKFHSASKASRSHDLIPYKEVHQLPQIAKNVRETCVYHKRKVEMYCSDHLEAYCIICSKHNHRTCTNISLIEDVTSNVRSSVALVHISERLNTLISKIELTIDKKEESVIAIGDQAKDIRKEVQGMEAKFKKKLHSLVEKVVCDVEMIGKDHEEKTSGVIKTLKTNLNIFRTLKATVGQLIENGTNLQIFLCLKELDSQIATEESKLATYLESGELHNTHIYFKYDDAFKKLTLVESIGNVETERKPLEMYTGSFEQCALSTNATKLQPCDINKIKLTKKSKIDFATWSPYVTNCIVLHNDCMLFTDFSKNSRLMLYDPNGNFLRHIKMESKPFDVAKVSDDVIATTLTGANKAVFLEFTLNEDNIVKEISTVGQCYGIDYSEHRLAVAVKEHGIQIFADDGTQMTTIPFACTVLAFINGNIAYIEVNDNVVRCCNMMGKHMWEWKIPQGKFYDFPSITDGGGGNLYIADCGNYDVFILSKDGSSHKKLLQKSDGLCYTNGIYFNKRRQELLLCTNQYKEAVLYNVTE